LKKHELRGKKKRGKPKRRARVKKKKNQVLCKLCLPADKAGGAGSSVQEEMVGQDSKGTVKEGGKKKDSGPRPLKRSKKRFRPKGRR